MGSLSHLAGAAETERGSTQTFPETLCLLTRTHTTRRQPTTTPRRAPPTQPPHDGASGGVVGGSPSAQRTSSSAKRSPGLGSAARAEPSSRLFLPANFKVTHCRCHHSPITARVWPPLRRTKRRVSSMNRKQPHPLTTLPGISAATVRARPSLLLLPPTSEWCVRCGVVLDFGSEVCWLGCACDSSRGSDA